MAKQSHCVFIQVAARTAFHPFTLEMQHVPQRAERARAGKLQVDEAPAPHKEKLPPVPNHQPALSFCTSVKDLILIVFLSLVLSVLTAPSRRKGKEGRPEKGSGDWKGKGTLGPSCGALQWGEEAPVHSFKGMW